MGYHLLRYKGDIVKSKELRKCIVCGNGMMHAGDLCFFKIEIVRYIVNTKNIQRTHGLEQFFGGGQTGAMLANVMGEDPEIADKFFGADCYMCERCAIEKDIFQLFEKAAERAGK